MSRWVSEVHLAEEEASEEEELHPEVEEAIEVLGEAEEAEVVALEVEVTLLIFIKDRFRSGSSRISRRDRSVLS